MNRLEVLFIRTIKATEPWKRISHIGGRYGNYHWLHTIEEATSNYLNRTFSYYIDIRGDKHNLIIQRTKDREHYFKTKCDAELHSNLLMLEEFAYSGEIIETSELLQLIKGQTHSSHMKRSGSMSINIPDDVACEIELVSAERFIKQLNEDQHLNNFDNPFCEKASLKNSMACSQDGFLCVLSGKWANGMNIMSKSEFSRVVEYYNYTIGRNQLPNEIKKIPRTMASTEFVRYTFYLLWKKNKTLNRTVAINFLHAVFDQFSNIELSTTIRKFSSKFKGYEDFVESLSKGE